MRGDPGTSAQPSRSPGQRWLLLVHTLPTRPSNLRVRTWRRLQQLGALPLKQAAYVLPDSPATREDFQWLKAEIEAARGEASVFTAEAVDAVSDAALVEEFRASSEGAYQALERNAARLLKHVPRHGRVVRDTTSQRRAVQRVRERLATIERIDFFGAPGRNAIETTLQQIDERLNPQPSASPARRSVASRDGYQGRLWVTRPRPGVDRMASAWLIKRFVDADARFDFVTDHAAAPPGSLAFDMVGVEYTHRGDRCTFEVLCDAFGLREAALSRVAEVVHDLDLKDERYGAPETATLGVVIDGLQLAHRDDHRLLAGGSGLFEALYQSFVQRERQSSPARKSPNRRGATRRA